MSVVEVFDGTIHVGDRIADLAKTWGEQTAMVVVDRRGREKTLSWNDLESGANAAARTLEKHGVKEGDVVGVALPSGFEHAVCTIGAWKVGATVVPLNYRAGERERRLLKETIGGIIVGEGDWAAVSPSELGSSEGAPFPGRGTPRSASVSGGSTGLPRVIVRDRVWRYPKDGFIATRDVQSGAALDQTQLVVLPLYHAGFTAVYQGLALHHKVVLLPDFNARVFFEAIGRHKVQYIRIVPSYMRLALDLPNLEAYDVSSVQAINHGSAACPGPVKRRWIEIFGAKKVIEDYACMERIGIVTIRGDEWLEHPGSVGKPQHCSVKILGDDGSECPAGAVGMIYVCADGAKQPQYLGGGAPLAEQNGYRSVGDLGYLDEGGYLYLVDRKINVINSGGIDIYPAEIEATLLEHPGVADAVVVGRPHEYLGKSLHAIVVPANPAEPPTPDALDQYSRSALSMAKVPMSWEFRSDIGRTETGKLRRADLEA